MMTNLNFTYWSRVGFHTLFTSIRFFYKHGTLLIISLIPAFCRAIQMLSFNNSILLEGIVSIARITLFVFILSFLTKVPLHKLKSNEFWTKLFHLSSKKFEKYWPYGVVAQIIVFIVFLFGVGNGLIYLISHLFIHIVQPYIIGGIEVTALYYASVYFLKNISVIPLALVYIVHLFGVKQMENV